MLFVSFCCLQIHRTKFSDTPCTSFAAMNKIRNSDNFNCMKFCIANWAYSQQNENGKIRKKNIPTILLVKIMQQK